MPAAGDIELCDPGCCGEEYGARYIGPVGCGPGGCGAKILCVLLLIFDCCGKCPPVCCC